MTAHVSEVEITALTGVSFCDALFRMSVIAVIGIGGDFCKGRANPVARVLSIMVPGDLEDPVLAHDGQ